MTTDQEMENAVHALAIAQLEKAHAALAEATALYAGSDVFKAHWAQANLLRTIVELTLDGDARI